MRLENKLEIKGRPFFIFKGILISVVVILILLLIYSILLAYTSIPETTMSFVGILITAIGIFIGSLIVTRNTKKNGIINGGLIGFGYLLIAHIVSAIISGINFTPATFVMIIIGILSGMLGGIIGVNISR